MRKISLYGLLVLLCCGAATTQPQQDEAMVATASRKIKATMAEAQRDASVVHLRLLAELDKAQLSAEAQQEQARLDLASKMALAMARLAKGSDDKGPELRKAFGAELMQAGQSYNQRLTEIDSEQNQAIAQAVQRFNQQKAELLAGYSKDLLATLHRLQQEMAAPDLGPSVASFKVKLPDLAQPASPAAETKLAAEYRADTDAARKAFTEAMNEARSKLLVNIQASLDAAAAPQGPTEEQATEIRNAIKRLGLWAADSMDTYQIALKRSLRKYQLGENRPQADAKTP